MSFKFNYYKNADRLYVDNNKASLGKAKIIDNEDWEISIIQSSSKFYIACIVIYGVSSFTKEESIIAKAKAPEATDFIEAAINYMMYKDF